MKRNHLFSNIIRRLASLLRPLFRITLHHENLATDFALLPNQPVCYVIKYQSAIEAMLLESICKQHDLPPPHYLPEPSLTGAKGTYIFLQKRGWLKTTNKNPAPPAPLNNIVSYGKIHPEYNMQFVPVHIYWGRNPGKEDSALKLLFFDDEFSGLVQRFLTIIYQARRVQVRFGQALKLQDIYNDKISAEDAAKKLKRIIRVHFRNIRTALLGPQLYTVELATRSILRAPAIKQALEDQSRRTGQTNNKLDLQAQKIIREISADTSYSFVRFFDIVLPRLFRILYDGVDIKNGDYLRQLAETHTLVYLPCHRSHVDYLLVGFFIHAFGLMSPHIGGGDNLNFWPVGPLLRRAGAFFLRRKFGGNRLYSAIFNEYIHYLISKGHPLAFFPEGGRSRTGFLLQPKTGMLAMVVHSFLRNRKPIALIPISITYDQVIEVETYQKELSGSKKEKENISGLLKATRVLRKKHGKAYLKFGSPIDLENYFDEHLPNWRDLDGGEIVRPSWLSQHVAELAKLNFERINDATVISPVALIVAIILATPQRALSEDDLLDAFTLFKNFLIKAHDQKQIEVSCDDPQAALASALTYSKVMQHGSSFGNVYHISEEDSLSLYYYKNNITHLLATGSMIASFFSYNDHMKRSELISFSSQIVDFLQDELFISSPKTSANLIEHTLNCLIELKLLNLSDTKELIFRPPPHEKAFMQLQILARIAGGLHQQLAIIATTLEARISLKIPTSIDEIIKESQSVADRFTILGGIPGQHGIPRDFGYDFYYELVKTGKISIDESGIIHGSESFLELEIGLKKMLSPDIVTSLLRYKGSL